MKPLLLILFFFSAGIQAQIKKHEPGKRNNPEKKGYFKTNKKTKATYGIKNVKDDQLKRIINLSQQKETPKKELVKKNNNSDGGSIIYEEMVSVKYKMYLFIGLDAYKNGFLRNDTLILREI
jgi:hypothetical protein